MGRCGLEVSAERAQVKKKVPTAKAVAIIARKAMNLLGSSFKGRSVQRATDKS